MGLLDSVIGAVTQGMGQGQGGGGNAALLNLVLSMLAGGAGGAQQGGGGGGGLGGLGQMVEQFQRGGLGDIMSSWISTGQNLPISPEQLGQVFGQGRVSDMASQLGMGQNDLLGQLSQMLPQVVDKLTPDGQLPAAGQAMPDLGQLGSLLGGLLNKQ
jgi:uncharacterized protein YidB (DUF937 family)